MNYFTMKSLLEAKGVTNDIAFYALYGSQNYEVDTEKSDFDYVVYVFPTSEDFLKGTMKEKTYSHDEGLLKVRDVRKISDIVLKPTISNLELLVSKESYNDKSLDRVLNKMRKELKNQIVLNKRRVLFSSVGMCNSYMKQYHETGNEKYLMRALMFYGITNVSVTLANDKKVKFEDCLTAMNSKVMKEKMKHFKTLSLEGKADFSNEVASKVGFLKRMGDALEDKENEALEKALNKRLLKVLKGRL